MSNEIVVADNEVFFFQEHPHAKFYILMRSGHRYMKVPARVMTWQDETTRSLHLVVESVDYLDAEEWTGP